MAVSALPVFSGEIVSRLGPLLGEADRAGHRLEAAVRCLPTPDGFLEMQARREAVASARLDGHSVSVSDLAGRGSPQEADHEPAVWAARCCMAAVSLERSAGSDEARLSWPWLSRLYRVLGGLGEAQPERPSAATEAALSELDRYVAGNAGLPALLRVGVMQGRLHQLELFEGQPDRLARTLGIGGLFWLDVPGRLGLAPSDSLTLRLDEYRYRLTALREGTGWQGWLQYFVQCFAQAASAAEEILWRFAMLREEHRMTVAEALGHSAHRGLKMLDRLAHSPVANVADVREVTGTSYVAANQLVSRLVDLGIIEEVTGFRRNRHFLYGACVALFSEGSAGADSPPEPVAQAPPPEWVPTGAPAVAPPPVRKPRPRVRKAALADHLL